MPLFLRDNKARIFAKAVKDKNEVLQDFHSQSCKN